MINLKVGIMRLFMLGMFLLLQESGFVTITSPTAGTVIRGSILVVGSTDVQGFLSSDVSFAYAGGSAETWFSIATNPTPVNDGQIAVWDTGSITDGTYMLRLRVTFQDGTVSDAVVSDLKLRNYTVEPGGTDDGIPDTAITPSPGPTLAPTASVTSTTVAVPTLNLPMATPLSPNSASLDEAAVYRFLRRGAVLALVALLTIGFALRLRRD